VNDDQHVTFESKVSASLITTTTDFGGSDRDRAQAESAANASSPEKGGCVTELS
tara:strand:+ start:492 stop:653 length:162 start_codon:yes stop_codon:yes gene_type:complete